MKNLITLIFCLALCLTASAAKADITINYDYSQAIDGTLTTSNSWAIVDTFDSEEDPGWTYSDDGESITSGTEIGAYAAPYNPISGTSDSTNYYAVSVGTVEVSFGGEYNYLGLFWGSADSYNLIEFYNGETLIASYSGDDVLNPANGDQSASATNQYVNFCLTQSFDTVKFVSTGIAFEFDNLAVGTHVPVPGAVLLGLIGLGFAGRKLRKYA